MRNPKTPPLHREPRRVRPPFDCDTYEPIHRQADETLGEWSARDLTNRVAALLEALDGIELGDYDRRIIDWLAGWDTATVGTVASLLYRCREAGIDHVEEVEGLRAELEHQQHASRQLAATWRAMARELPSTSEWTQAINALASDLEAGGAS